MPWQVDIPRAVQLVIDDVGWREGWRLDVQGGPYRAGIDRLLQPADYAAIADLGAALSLRPTAAMVLCEWDRDNVCARQPTCTAAGAAWDNRSRAGTWSDEAAAVFAQRAAHLELALHGVGHEHWDDGRMTRAEYYSPVAGKWRWADLQGHLEVFRALLDQHHLGPAAGHRFPLHFIPCAFAYLLDEADPQDTGALVAGAGARYCSTPFGCLTRRSDLAAATGGVNHGVLIIDRGGNGVPWYAIDAVPEQVMGEVRDDTGLLDEAAAAAPTLGAEEIELLLARRVVATAADLQPLIDAHVPVAVAMARLYAGRGLSAADLLAAARDGLARAVARYDANAGIAFATCAELAVQTVIEHALATCDQPAPHAAPVAPGSICGIHWPNLLSTDPAANGVAVGHWCDYLRQVSAQPGQLLAANTREAFAQWAWHTFGRVTGTEDGFALDLSAVPTEVRALVAELPVIVEVGGYQRLGAVGRGDLRPVWYRRQGGRSFVAVRPAHPAGGSVAFESTGPLQPVVLREGTANVLDLRPSDTGLLLDVEVFGEQVLQLAPGFAPGAVTVTAGRLELTGRQDNPALGVVNLRLRGHDLQGEVGQVAIRRADSAAVDTNAGTGLY